VHWTSANGDPKLRRKSSGSTSGDSGGGSGGSGGSLPWGWTRSRSVSEETHEVHWFLYPLAGPTHIDSSPSEMNDPHFHSHQQAQEQRQEQSSRRHQAAARKQTNKEEEDEEEDNEEAYDKFDQPLRRQGQGHGQGGVDVWYEQWDELNRASYYYHAATGESQWESPEWVEETDPASGARYY
jgi:hypothetical protein